jgi:hypothetical protein
MDICFADGCGRKVWRSGLCAGHYKRQQRRQPLDEPLRGYKQTPNEVVKACAMRLVAVGTDGEADELFETRLRTLLKVVQRLRKPARDNVHKQPKNPR